MVFVHEVVPNVDWGNFTGGSLEGILGGGVMTLLLKKIIDVPLIH